MKTSVLVSIVVGIHCIAVGCLVIQGCGTARGTGTAKSEEVIMPGGPAPQATVVTEKKAVFQPPRVEQAPKSWSDDETTTYVVRKGDSLSGIAHRYKLSVKEIAAFNSMDTKSSIRVGQKLILPGKIDIKAEPVKTVKKPAVAGAAPAVAGATVSGNTYVVKPGDCLSVVASQHGVRTDEIRKANGLSSDALRVGQKLNIPVASKKEVKTAVPAAETASPVVTPQVSPAPVTTEANPVTAAVEKPAQVSSDAGLSVSTTHVVAEGETLEDIAIRWGTSAAALRGLNGLKEGDELIPGQVLRISGSE